MGLSEFLTKTDHSKREAIRRTVRIIGVSTVRERVGEWPEQAQVGLIPEVTEFDGVMSLERSIQARALAVRGFENGLLRYGSEEEIREVRRQSISINSYDIHGVIHPGVVQNIQFRGERELGTTSVGEWFAAHALLLNEMTRGVATNFPRFKWSRIDVLPTIPEAVVMSRRTHPDRILPSAWTCHSIDNIDQSFPSAFSQPIDAALMWVIRNRENMPFNSSYMEWHYVAELAKTLKVDLGLIHELYHQLGAGDVYWSTGKSHLPSVFAQRIFMCPDDLMSGTKLRLTPVSIRPVEAIKRINPYSQSVLTDPIRLRQYNGNETDGAYNVFSRMYKLKIFSSAGDNITSTVSGGFVLDDMREAGVAHVFDPWYLSNSDKNEVRFDASLSSTDGKGFGTQNGVLDVFHLVYLPNRSDNQRLNPIIIPRLVMNMIALSEEFYGKVDGIPEMKVQYSEREYPVTTDAIYMYTVKGRPIEIDGVYASMRIPGSEDALVWSVRPLEGIATVPWGYSASLPLITR